MLGVSCSAIATTDIKCEFERARLPHARITNVGAVPLDFSVRSMLVPVINALEETNITPTPGHRFIIDEAPDKTTYADDLTIANPNPSTGHYPKLSQESSPIHLEPGDTLDYSMDMFSYISGISGWHGNMSWDVDFDRIDILLNTDASKSPDSQKFVTTPADLAKQAALYKKYFMADNATATDRDVWADFLSQGSGVLDDKRAEEVIVTLTSYPARFETTWLAIESLLRQTERPDRVNINLFDGEFPGHVLPFFLRHQMRRGLEINWCPENLKVYLKAIPTIQKFPEAAVVATDDDIIYPVDRLGDLVEGHRKQPDCVIAFAVRQIIFDSGFVLPVSAWDFTGRRSYSPEIAPSYNMIPEGILGIYFPPHTFNTEIMMNQNLYSTLAPSDDDLWGWAMSVLNSKKTFKIESRYSNRIITDGSQAVATSLFKTNFNNRSKPLTKQFLSVLNFFNLHNKLSISEHYESFEKMKVMNFSRLKYASYEKFNEIDKSIFSPVQLLNGFGANEHDHVWGFKGNAKLRVFGTNGKKLKIEFVLVPFVHSTAPQSNLIIYNESGALIREFTFLEKRQHIIDFIIDIGENNFETLTLAMPNCVNLFKLNLGNDCRDLSVAFQTYKIDVL